ncbi:hypothetical protein QC763_0018550 [Podospora pseudopauciseta]|uniref:Uncharacterized protein n=2 Tax=Podospora TaxID=5144 RepID=A0ABR0I0J2_9PEZI|nr:hypothetical protein QC763_0018550 [Podospora pseudopauciseta]KAK4682373.1 hypothetical protein QC764_0018500 [Podospora pseudoanserina]
MPGREDSGVVPNVTNCSASMQIPTLFEHPTGHQLLWTPGSCQVEGLAWVWPAKLPSADQNRDRDSAH